VPTLSGGDLLIAVEAAGVNRPDIAQRKGVYAPPPGASDLPGLEVAGTVAAIDGPGPFRVGDRVCALVNGGGYAAQVRVPVGQCLPVPAGLSMIEAAAIPETFFTVWSTVFMRGRLRPGETFLVHGGASGIGTTAIMLAKALGHSVFATAGTADKCAACVKLGAEVAIDYRTEDFVSVLREKTGRRGVDVILDMVGGSYLPRDLELAAVDGRIVMISFLGGHTAQLDLRPILTKRLTVTGATLRPQSTQAKADIASELRQRVWPLLDSGHIKPVIHATFPLEKAAEAHTMLEGGEHVGKIVLTL